MRLTMDISDSMTDSRIFVDPFFVEQNQSCEKGINKNFTISLPFEDIQQ